MISTAFACDRCRQETGPAAGMVELTHDANDEHPCNLPFIVCDTFHLCRSCSIEFAEWLKAHSDALSSDL